MNCKRWPAKCLKLTRKALTWGLTPEETAFYDAPAKPYGGWDFYSNSQLKKMTRELLEELRKNRRIDWREALKIRQFLVLAAMKKCKQNLTLIDIR